MRIELLPLLVVPLLAFSLASVPGIEMVTETTDLQAGVSWTNTVSVAAGNLHMDFGDAERSRSGSLVYVAERTELILNEDRERSYLRVGRADAEAYGSVLSDAMSQAEKAMAALPQAQRELIEKAGGLPSGGGGMFTGPRVELRETGETATKAGFDRAKRFDLYMNDQLMQKIWYADWSEVEKSGELRQAFVGVASVWQSFIEALGQAPFNGFHHLGDTSRGVPVLTTTIDEEGNPSLETVLRSITAADIDPTIFAPTEGYREKPLPRLGG